jgi:ribosomal-protein-alanine N-acetyltransferase
VSSLQRLRLDHGSAVLDFERANRGYFAAFISDRGDDFFEQFSERHRAMLDEQEAGRGAYYVLVDATGAVVGRFNLYNIVGATADVGYRIAQRVAGRGVASSGVRDLCRIAGEDHGLRVLNAATSDANIASQHVLTKAGFVITGAAEVEGVSGRWYRLVLTPP